MALLWLVLSAPFAAAAVGVASLAVLVGFGVWSGVPYWGVLVVGLVGLLVSWGGLDDWRKRRRGEQADCKDEEDPKRYLFSGLIVIAVTVTLGGLLVSNAAVVPSGLSYLFGVSTAVVVRAAWRKARRKKARRQKGGDLSLSPHDERGSKNPRPGLQP